MRLRLARSEPLCSVARQRGVRFNVLEDLKGTGEDLSDVLLLIFNEVRILVTQGKPKKTVRVARVRVLM